MTANFIYLRQQQSALVESWNRRLDLCAPNSPEARAVFAEAARDGLVYALREGLLLAAAASRREADLLEALRREQ
jgi:hypothetical protein